MSQKPPEVAALEESLFELEYAIWELQEVSQTGDEEKTAASLAKMQRAMSVLESAERKAQARLGEFRSLNSLVGERDDVAQLRAKLQALLQPETQNQA